MHQGQVTGPRPMTTQQEPHGISLELTFASPRQPKRPPQPSAGRVCSG